MAVNATSALAASAAGLEPPAHDPSKDDDGFDSALGMAMFAMPSSLAMPAWNITHAQQKSAGSADALPADGVAAADGDPRQSTTSPDARNLAAVSDPAGAWSRFASADVASLEKLADLAPGAESADRPGALRGSPLDNQKSSVQAASAEAPQASASTTLPNFLENFFAGALGGSVEITYHAGAASDPIADGTPATGTPSTGPVADGAPALRSSTSGPIGDGTAALTMLKRVPFADFSAAVAAARSAHTSQSESASGATCGVEDVDSEYPTTSAGTSASGEVSDATRAGAPSTVNSHDAQIASAITPASSAAGGNVDPSSASSGEFQGDATSLATPLSGQSSESLIASAIGQAMAARQQAGAELDDKHDPVSKMASDPASPTNFGADLAATPAIIKGPSEAPSGAAQPTAAVAPTLRAFAAAPSDARIANLTIDLAGGQTTHATVRENAGAVEVRIVTSTQQSAQAISSELPSLRRALDSAGMQLKAADISHHGSVSTAAAAIDKTIHRRTVIRAIARPLF